MIIIEMNSSLLFIFLLPALAPVFAEWNPANVLWIDHERIAGSLNNPDSSFTVAAP